MVKNLQTNGNWIFNVKFKRMIEDLVFEDKFYLKCLNSHLSTNACFGVHCAFEQWDRSLIKNWFIVRIIWRLTQLLYGNHFIDHAQISKIKNLDFFSLHFIGILAATRVGMNEMISSYTMYWMSFSAEFFFSSIILYNGI